MSGKRAFPDWEKLYREEPVEKMPWFHSALDHDLEGALERLGVKKGKALDLGAGPGTQAIELARRGFEVTATDISGTAVKKAQKAARKEGLNVKFKKDDILETRLKGPFDIAFDRGCFHVLPPEARADYVNTVSGLLKPGGFLFLKCFSHLEKMEGGPHRFRPEEIKKIFSSAFEIVEISKTVFHGTLKEFPKALFCVLKKR